MKTLRHNSIVKILDTLENQKLYFCHYGKCKWR